jgi:hypothetical protein
MVAASLAPPRSWRAVTKDNTLGLVMRATASLAPPRSRRAAAKGTPHRLAGHALLEGLLAVLEGDATGRVAGVVACPVLGR